jgi:hypothetical protein
VAKIAKMFNFGCLVCTVGLFATNAPQGIWRVLTKTKIEQKCPTFPKHGKRWGNFTPKRLNFQEAVQGMVPRGGVRLFPAFNNLACPTFGKRPIEFQGLISGLSHPNSLPRNSPLLAHKRTSTLVVGVPPWAKERHCAREAKGVQ